MTTKYNRLVINLTESGNARVQKLLFQHGISWNNGRRTVLSMDKLEPRCQMFKLTAGEINRDNVIYHSEARFDCLYKAYTTLVVNDTELDKILDWINSEFEKEIVIKLGQCYSLCDGSVRTLIGNCKKDEYQWLKENYYDNRFFDLESLISSIKSGGCKLIE